MYLDLEKIPDFQYVFQIKFHNMVLKCLYQFCWLVQFS